MSWVKTKFRYFCALFFLVHSLSLSSSTTSQNLSLTTVRSTNSILPEATILDPNAGQKLGIVKDSTSSYPETIVTQDENGTYSIKQVFQNRTTKNMFPQTVSESLQSTQAGFLGITGSFKSPSGSDLFQSGSLNSQFDSLMGTLSGNTAFVGFFRKVHLNILNELYEHLMNIYTNFNLHHPGSTWNDTTQSVDISVSEYLSNQEKYAFNLKTLIINHLVNLIEEQFNSSIVAMMPAVPQLFATKVGKTTIFADYSIDLTEFLIKDISGSLTQSQLTYLNALQKYLTFFKDYTSLISVNDDTTGFSQYCSTAERIHDFLNTTDMNTMLTKMNPAMFFYDEDTMRALRIIPHLAKKMPQNVSSIGWPKTISDHARDMKLISSSSAPNHPVAYFTDKNGKITTSPDSSTSDTRAVHLYACIQSGENLFQEELLKQPDWLNSEEGILKILRACLGDFTALLDMNILNCYMENLIHNALNLSITDDESISTTCKAPGQKSTTTETENSTTTNNDASNDNDLMSGMGDGDTSSDSDLMAGMGDDTQSDADLMAGMGGF